MISDRFVTIITFVARAETKGWNSGEGDPCPRIILESLEMPIVIGFPDDLFKPIGVWGRGVAGLKRCGGEAFEIPDRQLFLRERPRAFRPCVLFLENVPAETH
jgi:hypothetical protein